MSIKNKSWIGQRGTVMNLTDVDRTGTSYMDRYSSNKRNLDDLINYLEYAKDTGFCAARADLEQEEYWAQLIRDMLMFDIISRGVFMYEDKEFKKCVGVTFRCTLCGYISTLSLNKEKNEYEIISGKCSHISERENDIVEYLTRIIKNNKKEKEEYI